MANILNTVLDFMGFIDTDEDSNYKNNETEAIPRNHKKNVVSLHSKVSQPIIIHITPNAFDDVMDITKRLQEKMIVTINLTSVDESISERIIDFLNGCVYALDGGVMKLANDVYVFAGHGVTLQERGF